MKRFYIALACLLALAATAFASNEKEADRVKEAGEVLKEIINICRRSRSSPSALAEVMDAA